MTKQSDVACSSLRLTAGNNDNQFSAECICDAWRWERRTCGLRQNKARTALTTHGKLALAIRRLKAESCKVMLAIGKLRKSRGPLTRKTVRLVGSISECRGTEGQL